MATDQVGNRAQQIKLPVDINTLGLAASRAIVLDLSFTCSCRDCWCHFKCYRGRTEREIGTADGKKLSILTKNRPDWRPGCNSADSERLTRIYILNNGVEGFRCSTHQKKRFTTSTTSITLLYS